MIEKWRPAKDGDSGLVRYRLATQHYWTYDYINYVNFDSNGYAWIGSWHYIHCEVLEAYLSDEEVESLACRVAGECMDYGQGTCEQRCAFAREIIEKHFSE